jgi:hypothetical protein
MNVEKQQMSNFGCMKKIGRLILLMIPFLAVILSIFTSGCRKEPITDDPSARLTIDRDTLTFDTVFTKLGSATRNFLVRNTNNKAAMIKKIYLAGGDKSPFKININGRPASSYENLQLSANDSFYNFVQVTIDPNNQNQPFVVMDSVMFEINGNIQKVILIACGQNAHFFTEPFEFSACNDVWTNDKPYVILKNLVVAQGCTLTIRPGVRIYSHRGSYIYVAGTLIVDGTRDEPVIFTGDRLEPRYKDEPSQWGGIRLIPKSQGNLIKHAIISNGETGVEVDSLPVISNIPNLLIEKTIIRNMAAGGLVGYTSTIIARNILVHSCGQRTFFGQFGGDYDFTQCTFDNTESAIAHRAPSFYADNANFPEGNIPDPLKLQMRNCIVWGSEPDEIEVKKVGNAGFDTLFNYNFIRSGKMKFNGTNKMNTSPGFKNISQQKYQPDSLSLLINYGVYYPAPHDVHDDLEDQVRDANPEVGAYEKK